MWLFSPCHEILRGVRVEPWDDAVTHLADLADEVETTHGRVVLTREGRPDLVLLSADDLASLEETIFWQRDERSAPPTASSPARVSKVPD